MDRLPPPSKNYKRPRLADVAARARVSPMTASSVLSGGGGSRIRVGAETAARVRKIAKEMGYRPSLAAQQLSGKSSKLIGVVAQDWFHSETLRFLSWMSKVADENGYRVITSQTKANPEALAEYVRECAARGVDGLVYMAWLDDPIWESAKTAFDLMPRVVCLWGDPGIPHAHVVQGDFARTTASAVEHLYARGRRRIVQVLEDVDSAFNRERRQGVIAGYEACGLNFSDDAICLATKDWPVDDPRFDDLIDELVFARKADGILADIDDGAMAMMNALRRRGMTPGKEVAFVGWGHERHGLLAAPPLTTVRIRLELLAAEAFRLASAPRPDAEIERIVIPGDLVIRQSS